MSFGFRLPKTTQSAGGFVAVFDGKSGLELGSSIAKFVPYSTPEGNATVLMQSISCMPAFADKNFEELRFEDYKQKLKGAESSAIPKSNSPPLFGVQSTIAGFGSTHGFSSFGSTAGASSSFGALQEVCSFGL